MSVFSHLGVDSYIPANDTSYFGNSGRTFYDAVTEKLRYRIEFWGRYIGASKPLTLAECKFLHDRNCKILVIYNGTSTQSVRGNFSAGEQDAKKAIEAANLLKIPDGIFIYANIDSTPPMNPSTEWIRGWWTKMYNSIYGGVGGIYMGLDISRNYCEIFKKVDSDARKSPPEYPTRIINLSLNSSFMLGKIVNPPNCHPNGFRIKQDTMKYPIFSVKGGSAAVDLDSASDSGLSGMW